MSGSNNKSHIPGSTEQVAQRKAAYEVDTGKKLLDPFTLMSTADDPDDALKQFAELNVGDVEQQLRDLAIKQEEARMDKAANQLLDDPELGDAVEVPIDDPVLGIKLLPTAPSRGGRQRSRNRRTSLGPAPLALRQRANGRSPSPTRCRGTGWSSGSRAR